MGAGISSLFRTSKVKGTNNEEAMVEIPDVPKLFVLTSQIQRVYEAHYFTELHTTNGEGQLSEEQLKKIKKKVFMFKILEEIIKQQPAWEIRCIGRMFPEPSLHSKLVTAYGNNDNVKVHYADDLSVSKFHVLIIAAQGNDSEKVQFLVDANGTNGALIKIEGNDTLEYFGNGYTSTGEKNIADGEIKMHPLIAEDGSQLEAVYIGLKNVKALDFDNWARDGGIRITKETCKALKNTHEINLLPMAEKIRGLMTAEIREQWNEIVKVATINTNAHIQELKNTVFRETLITTLGA